MYKKNNNKGITLLALVVTIIIMIILAAVSINAAIGEDGILGETAKTKELSKRVLIKEKLEESLIGFHNSRYVDEEDGLSQYLLELVKNDKIDNFISSTDGEIVYIQKDGENFQWKEDETKSNTFYVSEDIDANISAMLNTESVAERMEERKPSILVTQNTLQEKQGSGFSFSSGTTYLIIESLAGNNFDFKIPAGDPITIKIAQPMTVDNSGRDVNGKPLDRSAIDLEVGATLNLYVFNNVEVNSSYGRDADVTTPGTGAYAGIHVPKGATLNLYGTGTLKAYGGNAGTGGVPSGAENGGAGGGGAGAGIGGNGGDGGSWKTGVGASGKKGEDAGDINIHNSLTVYAYGGGGGSGGQSSPTLNDATGGGGYPAAGIGGGGAGAAGATCCAGGGGFSGGSPENSNYQSKNGLASVTNDNTEHDWWNGGGYFSGAPKVDDKGVNRAVTCFGGYGGQGAWGNTHRAGDGGEAGDGGNVKVNTSAKVYAFNGNRYTDGTSYSNGLNQCPIYVQCGIKPARYSNSGKYGAERTNFDHFELIKSVNQGTASKLSYVNTLYSSNNTYKSKKSLNVASALGIASNILGTVDLSKQGIGSGAGYIENTNGTYVVTSLN